MNSSDKLSSLRSQMSKEGIDAFIIGSGDAHQSEYVPECEMRRQFISNFTGSAGTALVLHSKALLWTDGRYFLQCSKELTDDWVLMKSGQPGVLDMNDWLAENLNRDQTVGFDAFLFSAAEVKRMKSIFEPKGIFVKAVSQNPIDTIWENRPAMRQGSVNIHDIALAGKSHCDKIKQIQEHLRVNNSSAIVFSMLDEV